MIGSTFFIAGAPGPAVASLAASLDQHPGLVLRSLESPFRPWPALVSDLKGQLADYEVSSGPRTGTIGIEASRLFLRRDTAKELKAAVPLARVVLLLDRPVKWMRSWHHQLLALVHEDQVDFGQALAHEERRLQGHRLPRHAPALEALRYRDAARLGSQVEGFFEDFGRENVWVGLQEDWEKEPKAFLENLFTFLEVKPTDSGESQMVLAEKVLKGTHHFDWAVARVVGRLPGSRGLKSLFAKTLQARYRRTADRIFAPMSDQRINSILEEELLEEFESEVAKLSSLLERDLSHWNEPRFPRSLNEHHHHHH